MTTYNRWVFTQYDPTNGWELWITDGTAGGTSLLKDIYAGANGSSPIYITALGNGLALFQAIDPINGSELWVTDGTAAGTTLLKDIVAGAGSSGPGNITALGNGKAIFTAYDPTNGIELWITDGTAGGTTLLKDIRAGVGASNPANFTALGNGKAVFQAFDGTNGYELWITDGTAGGTVLLKDIAAGGGSSSPNNITALGDGKAVFEAYDGTNGRELWITDGTAGGTTLVKDIYAGGVGSSLANITALGNGKAVFLATDPTNGGELWITDGTTGGTTLVKDIYAGGVGSSPASITALGNGKAVFQAYDPTNGTELWITDGTTGGTTLLKDIYVGSSSYPNSVTFLGNGKALFSAQDLTNGSELWITDGTTAGTMLVKDIYSGVGGSAPTNITALGNGQAVFEAYDPVNGLNHWITDGTAAGTSLLERIDSGNYNSNPSNSTALGNGKAVFQARDDYSGAELWITDGTAGGTTLLKDIWVGAGASNPANFTALGNGKAVFQAYDGTNGYELWITDGTTGGTTLVKDIVAWDGGSYPTNITALGNGKAVFRAYDPTNGTELWITDGTAGGTTLLKDIWVGDGGSYPANITTLGNGKAVFQAYDPANGAELWITDGTAGGTTLLKDIWVGDGGSYPANFTALGNGQAVFQAYDGTNGTELWITDGTAGGTTLLKDIYAGAGSSSPANITALGNGKAVFLATDPTNGGELWITDGTTGGTTLVKDIYAGGVGSSPANITALGNGKAVFHANNGTNGAELWITDGTTGGTTLLKDIYAGSGSSSPTNITALGNGKAVFHANNGTNGAELWITDGTTGGTTLLKDIYAGSGSSSPTNITALGNGKALFSAYDLINGNELWITDGTAAGTILVRNIATNPYPAFFTGVNGSSVPTATNLNAAETYTEDTPLNLTNIVVSDADSPTVTATLTLSDTGAGALSTGTSGSVTSTYTPATGVWSATGAIADVNAQLAAVTFTPTANFNASFTIATSVSDGVAPAVTGSKAFTGVAVNDAATITGTAANQPVDDTATILPFGSVDLTDPDVPVVTRTLRVTQDDTAKGSFTPGSLAASGFTGSGGTWQLTGSLAALTTAVRQLEFAPTLNRLPAGGSEAASFTLTLTDAALPGNGSASNQAGISAKQLQGSNPGALNGLYWIDPDGAGAGAPVQAYCDMTTNGGGWTLVAKGSPGAPLADFTPNANTGSTPTPASASGKINFQGIGLDATDQAMLVINGTPQAPTSYGSAVLGQALTLQAGGATVLLYIRESSSLTYESTVTNTVTSVVVTSVNDAPVLDASKSPALATVAEDAGAPAGAVGTLVSALVDFASPVGPVDNVTDVDAGALLGIALTGTDTANGSWFYSTDNGANWLAVGAVSDASALLLAADANTRLYFQPAANFNGTVSGAITFRAWDQSSGSAGSKVNTSPNGGASAFSISTDTASIAVSSVNDAPTATDDTGITVAEDSAATAIAVLANDSTAPDSGETLSITAVTQPANGTVVITGGGTGLTFQPGANFNGPTAFTYTVSDGNGGTATANVSVTVTPVNDAPTINNDSGVTLAEDASATIIDVLANDSTAPDTGETLTVASVTQPATGGSVTLTSGVVRFTPTPNYNGTTTFTYTASDGNGGTGTATVTVTVTPVNDAPTATDDTGITVAEDSAATAIAVLANDSTAPDSGETLSITAVTQPANGTVVITGGGTGLTFQPGANFNGPTAFTYTVSDGNGGTATANVSVTVTPVNDAPTATDDTGITVAEDSAATAIAVLANDSTAPDSGETLSITAVTQPANGTVVITGGGTGLTFQPGANFNGPTAFTYTVSDGNGGTATANVSVTVTPVNDAPTATDDTGITVAEDSAATAIAVLANDSTAPDSGETLSITSVTQPANGTVVITGGGTGLTFQPGANFNGPTAFTYTVSDGNGGTATANVSVTVTPVNDAPTATDDTGITVAEDSAATAIAVLANDSTAPDSGETLSITAVTQPANGTVVITGGGTGLTFQPGANFNGPTAFTYTVSDGNGGTATANVSVTVTPVNDAPTATDDTGITVAEDSAATAIAVLANDSTAPDSGETLSITAVTQPANGTVVITGGGTGLTFQPGANFNGPTAFTYTVSDGNGGTATANVSVTVTPVNDAPTATDDTGITVAEDSAATAIAVLANDSTAPDSGETLSITAVTQPANGTVVITGGGTGLTFQPGANFNGPTAFTYTVSDGNGGTATANVSVTVTPVNDAPTATDDTGITVAEDSAATAIAVLANDSTAPDSGETLSITSVTQPANGTVVITGGGTGLTFQPGANFNGPTAFTYTVSDGNGGTATANVSVTVTPVNDAPTATDDTGITVAEDSAATAIAVLANDSTAPDSGETLSITAVTQPANGTVVITGGGTGLTFQPGANFNGPTAFTYTVSDGNGGTATANVSVTVTPVNDAPTATDLDTAETYTEDTPLNLTDIVVADVDSPNVTVTLTLSSTAAGALSTATSGAVTSTYNPTTGVWSASGAIADVNALLAGVTFTPALNFHGNFTIATSVSDGVAPAITGTKAFTGTPVNDAPTGGAAITGTPVQGRVLTADTHTLADVDGLGTLHYQWLRGGVAIAGAADAPTYTTTLADVGARISLRVSYTDGDHTAESVLSPDTATIGAPLAPPPGLPTLIGPNQGIGNDKLVGSNLAEVLLGGAAVDMLVGGGGNDWLDGGADMDTMSGQSGNDTYVVDNEWDQVYEDIDAGTDTVISSVRFVLGPNLENLYLSGVANINGTGNASANLIIGNAGNNTLAGGLGNDTLIGGDGRDVFVFDTAPSATNRDTIQNFIVADDTIQLSRVVFSALAPGALAAGAFVTGAAALDANDRIIYNSATGALLYDADGSGAGAAVQFATLIGVVGTLSAADFVVV